jgi:hypothetical protein
MRITEIIIIILLSSIQISAQLKIQNDLEEQYELVFNKVKDSRSKTDTYFRGSNDLKTHGITRSMSYEIISMDTLVLNNDCQLLSEEEKETCRNEFLNDVKQFESLYHSDEFHFGFFNSSNKDSIHLTFSNTVIAWHIDISKHKNVCHAQMSHNNAMLEWSNEVPQVKYNINDTLTSEVTLPATLEELYLSSLDFENEDYVYGSAIIKGSPYYVYNGLVKIQRVIDLVFKVDTGNQGRRAKEILNESEKLLFGEASEHKFQSHGINFSEIRTEFNTKDYKIGFRFANDIGSIYIDNYNHYLINQYGEYIDDKPYQAIILNLGDSIFYAKRNDKWGLINGQGKVLIPFTYKGTSGRDFYNLKYPITNHGLIEFVNDNNKSGYLNSSGDTIIPFEYSTRNTQHWKDGLKVLRKNKLGVVDTLGIEILPFDYHDIHILDRYSYILKDSSNVWSISHNGKNYPTEYKDISYCNHSDYLIVIDSLDKRGLVNRTNQIVLPCDYSYIGPFSEGKSFVSKTEKIRYGNKAKYACIDSIATFLTEYIFNGNGSFKDSMSHNSVWRESKQKYEGTYINHDFEPIVNFHFVDPPEFKYDACLADTLLLDKNGRKTRTYNSNETFLFTKKGESIRLDPKYAIWQLYFSDGLVGVQTNGLQGYANTKGQVVIEPKYDYGGYWSGNMAWVRKPNDEFYWILRKDK